MATRVWRVVDVQEHPVGGELEAALNDLQTTGWTVFALLTMKEWVVKIIAWQSQP